MCYSNKTSKLNYTKRQEINPIISENTRSLFYRNFISHYSSTFVLLAEAESDPREKNGDWFDHLEMSSNILTLKKKKIKCQSY